MKELTGRQDVQPFSGWKFAYGEGVASSVPTVLDTLATVQASRARARARAKARARARAITMAWDMGT